MEFFRDFLRNRHLGQVAFGLQRLTGILLAIYLLPHVLLNGTALVAGPEAFDALARSLDTPFVHGVELLVILGVVVHGFNGLRILLVDFLAVTRLQQRLLGVMALLGCLAMLYALWRYSGKLL